MKTSFWDRVLMFLYVLIALALCLGMALRPFGPDLIGDLLAGVERAAGRFFYLLIVLGLAAIVVLLSLYMLAMIFRKQKRRAQPFITVNSDGGGQVRIALAALAQLARQAVGHVAGVRDMKIDIAGDEDAIAVAVDLSLDSSAHVPTVTMNMQRTIRNHIESNCGVAVRDVEITVTSLTDAEATAEKSERRHWRPSRARAGKAEERAAVAGSETAPSEPAADSETVFEADVSIEDAGEPDAANDAWAEDALFVPDAPEAEEAAPAACEEDSGAKADESPLPGDDAR